MHPGQFAAIALALVIGITLGALGSGGSVITLPVLVYVAGVDPKTAVAMSLAVVGGTSIAGAHLHFRHGNFHAKAALLFAGGGIAGAYYGSALTHLFPPQTLMLTLAALMGVISILMLHGGLRDLTPGQCREVRCAVVGAGVGVLTGFLGVGGGFLIVPALVLLAGVEMKQAVGTSLAVIAANSAAGLAGQIRYVRLDSLFTLLLLGASLAGMMMGLTAMDRVPTERLNRVFAWILMITGCVIAAMQVAEIYIG